jgi:hypothetical protein
MKRVKLATAIGIAFLTISTAHAAVYDFDGFTISFNGTDWKSDDDYYTNNTISYDNTFNFTDGTSITTGGGVKSNTGMLEFKRAYFPTVDASGIGTNQSSTSTYSFTIQAKAGWEFNSVSASTYQAGEYSYPEAGRITTTGLGSFTVNRADGSGDPNTWNVVTSDVATSPNLTSGTWQLYGNSSEYGNSFKPTEIYDSNGNYARTFTSDNEHVPLTGASGSGTLTLSAPTNGLQQSSYAKHTDGWISIQVDALKFTAPVSPVPEPETYLMLLVGLGTVGVILRRQKTKQAGRFGGINA